MKRLIPLFLLLALSLGAEEGAYVPKENLKYMQEARELLHSGELVDVLKGIDMITYTRSKIALRDLIDTLEGDTRFPVASHNLPPIKFYAARALGKKGDPYSIPFLITEYKKYQDKTGEWVKKKRKLGDGVSDSSSTTSPYFYHDNEITIVLALGEILRALGDLGFTPESEETIKSALGHKNAYLRASAADAIYLGSKKELLPSLREALNAEKDDYAKVSLLGAIGGLERSPNQIFYSLHDYLKREEPELRRKASESLVRMDLILSAPFYEQAISIENDAALLAILKEDYRKIVSYKLP